MSADETGQTTVYYTPYNGNLVSIPNGTKNVTFAFSEISLALVSNHLADTLYDVFVFLDPADNTTIRLGTGPAWSTTTAGSSARGTGAGTTQLSRLAGLWTNTVAVTLRNGSSTYSVAIESALYVGSIYIDHTAGQVSAHQSWGQNRKYGIWNAYNREPIILQAGDSTTSWTYTTATIRASNATPASYSAAEFNVGSGTACNGMVALTGLLEEPLECSITQKMSSAVGNATYSSGVGINSITAYSGTRAETTDGSLVTQRGEFTSAPQLGLTVIASLELAAAANTQTWYGTQANMLLRARWRG